MTRPSRLGPFRAATASDAEALRDLEQAANLAALGHVFDPREYPFPAAGVLDRWRAVLEEEGVTVDVAEGPPGLVVFAAHDRTTLRHLAVHPEWWGRGVASAAIDRAVTRIRAGGATPRLWCLDANQRAMALYRRLGWEVSGAQRRAEWPPYPTEIEMVLRGSNRE
ncbi:MAG TPA: GNAT family N-acetyltransferase [Nocardioides sp.]|nr:GNAT family N-acetyltransferase [Nocardioides sp.]